MMKHQAYDGWKAVRRPGRRAWPTVLLAFVILVSLITQGALAAPGQALAGDDTQSASTQENHAGGALFAVALDEPARLAQAEAAGLLLYSHLSSMVGDYLLVGASPEVTSQVGFPLRLLDRDTSDASYYLAYPRTGARAVPWASYGRLLLDLGDQVLLSTSPEQAERLPDLGVEIARISLEPQPWPVQHVPEAIPLAITPDPSVQTMLSQVSTDTIYNYTAQLTGVQPATIGGAPYTISRRYTYSGTPIQKAGQFVGEHMQALGLSVENQVWGTSGTPSTYPNVVGQITGSANPGDIYIIGAHLDDVPTLGTAPGADDNASGSVGTLIAADMLSQYQWSCTLRFAFWTGEEQGLYGSAAYATRAKNQGENIKAYLNMDMISYNSGVPNEINLFAKSTVPGSVELMNLYADAISAYGLNLVPIKYTNDTMGNYSDNKSFWDKGYASILAIEDYYGDETPYYHTSSDTLSTLDMAYYTDFVKASLATFVHLTGCLITDPNNQPPTADPQTVTTPEDTSLDIVLTGSDPENSPLSYSVATGPSHGTLAGAAPDLTYQPVANYNGADSFTFTVSDGSLTSSPATVSIGVTGVNDPPLANPQSVATQQNTAVTITLSGSDMDGDPLSYAIDTPPAAGALSGAPPTVVYTPNSGYVGSDSFTFTVSDGTLTSSPATVSITVNPAGPRLYLGSSTSGTAGGVAFADEDMLIKDMGSGTWSLYIDGSDVGLASTDVDSFELLADGSLLMSFDTDFSLSGFGTVDDSDILRFTPTSTGGTTAGTWSWYFDGSDVGLTTSDEDVDALALLPDGRLLISTVGNVSVSGASGVDEDLLAFTPTALGATTSGTWALYFDGSDVGLSSTSNEDVNGVWVDAAGKIYLTTIGNFGVTGVSGDGSDIFACTPGSLGNTTTCTWAMYWDGSVNGFSGEDTDSFSVVP
jgi:hypothetical protein